MNRELIMSTLYTMLTSPPVVTQFTGDITVDDVVVNGVSDTSNLLVGMPITGRGMTEGTVLATIDPAVTLSKPPTLTAPGVTLTQGIANPMRILQPIGEVTAFPALMLVEGAEVYPSLTTGAPHVQSDRPQIITLEPYCWLYAASPDPNTVPNQIMNALLDAIDQAILPARGVYQNLGLRGIHHMRIEGRTLRAPGQTGTCSARLQFGIQVIQGVDTTPL